MHNIRYGYIFYPLAVGVCLAWAVTGYFYTSDSSQEMRASSERLIHRRPVLDMRMIEEKNIFKAETSTVKSTLDAVGFMPSGYSGEQQPAVQNQDMSLVGIFKGAYTSYAVVRYRGQSVLLKQGVEKDGLMLTEAGSTDVSVMGGGRTYRLTLDGEKTQTEQQTGQKAADALQERHTVTRREVIEKLSGVNMVMKQVQINPYEREGKFVGYRMNRLKPDSTLSKMGLLNGDVIIRLNGKPLKDPAIFFDALANSENLSAIIMDIERNNEKKTLYVEIK